MTRSQSSNADIYIRSIHLRDLDNLKVAGATEVASCATDTPDIDDYIQQMRRWYGPLKVLTLFPNPLQHMFSAFVAEAGGYLQGMIHVTPFNQTLSTWKIDRMLVNLAKGQAKKRASERVSAQATNGQSSNGSDCQEPTLHLGMDVG
ncbi:MAG: hypothetical protein AAGB19_14545, partial [Cyanobacteria bacterium P01_F01_bin.3]